MTSSPDCDDYTEKKGEQMMKAVEALITGGIAGDLKFKPEKIVALRACMESVESTLSEDDIKSIVTGNAKAKKVANQKLADVTEAPVKDEISCITCGTVVYPPVKGQTAAHVEVEFAELEKSTRRALRMLLGRDLGNDQSTSVSSGEVNTIVPGDDDSVAENPGPDNTLMIVGIVMGCFAFLALVGVAFFIHRKRKNSANAYTPHRKLAPLQRLQYGC